MNRPVFPDGCVRFRKCQFLEHVLHSSSFALISPLLLFCSTTHSFDVLASRSAGPRELTMRVQARMMTRMSLNTLDRVTDTLYETVIRAQGGDREAFDDLLLQFESRIFGIVMQRLRNTAEADEVVQEVFLRAFRKLPQLNEPERFGGWLCQIAVRLSINRAVRRPAETSCEPDSFDGLQSDPDNPFESLIRQENIEQLRYGLSQLGQLDRETLWAFYFEGSSLKEMSDQFESPIGTIKRRLHTARGRLRDVMGSLQPA